MRERGRTRGFVKVQHHAQRTRAWNLPSDFDGAQVRRTFHEPDVLQTQSIHFISFQSNFDLEKG
jgi:hypothetical protein